MAHHPVDVVYTDRVAPVPVMYGERTVPETRSLEPLVAIQNDDDWWLRFRENLQKFTKQNISSRT